LRIGGSLQPPFLLEVNQIEAMASLRWFTVVRASNAPSDEVYLLKASANDVRGIVGVFFKAAC
jgi:hypothetical protein